MGYEVELKYRLVDHVTLERQLAEEGANRGAVIQQKDVYLTHPCRDFASTHEAFRIRRIGSDNLITYKGPRHAGPTKTREEIELPVASGQAAFEQLLRMFENLGFRPIATIEKSRVPIHISRHGRDIEILLDRVTGVGDFAEIETLVEADSELPAAQAAILSVAEELGLTELEPRSYLRISLEARARSS